ncbi:MAG: cysteine desulfurase [Clostridiales Family XIII bacterium]|jgi:cysteine desulfurase|nr:cysteine desulfurase [Clostridiales Family XIII bacterium]
MIVYLDNSSTTKASEAVAASVSRVLTEEYGNPSSVHTIGQRAERILKDSRKNVAALIGAKPGQIIFTGSGTEADNLALHNAFKTIARTEGRKLITTQIEHPAVLEPALLLEKQGAKVVRLPVDGQGLVRVDLLKEALDEDTAIVSVMHVNNEIGTIQPIGEIGRILSAFVSGSGLAEHQILLHTDAVQSYAKLPVDIRSEDFKHVDFLSFSAHKIHGPKGVGALFAAHPERVDAIIRGGGQEGGMRSGTENMPGIAGFATAALVDVEAHARYVAEVRQYLLDGIIDTVNDIRVNSPRESSVTGEAGFCSPYILSVSFLGTRGEVILHELESKGIFLSTGSACASLGKGGGGGKGKMSHVLSAIGLTDKEAEGTLRFSFSRYNTLAEMDYVLEHLKTAVDRFRRIGTFR